VTVLPQLIVSTLLLGGIYALIAVGLTLIFGVMRVVNFRHGEFLMLGMYLAFFAFAGLHLDPYLTLIVVFAADLVRGRLGQLPRRDAADRPRLAQRPGVHHGRALDRAPEPRARAVHRRRPFPAHGLLRGRRADRRRAFNVAQIVAFALAVALTAGSSRSCAVVHGKVMRATRRIGTPPPSWVSTPTGSMRSPGP